MSAKLSEEMRKARKRLAADPSQSRAKLARSVGLSRDALYKDPVCSGIIKKLKEKGTVEK